MYEVLCSYWVMVLDVIVDVLFGVLVEWYLVVKCDGLF